MKDYIEDIDESRILFSSLLTSFHEENVQFYELTILNSTGIDTLDRDILPFCRFYYGNRKRGLLGMEENPSVTNEDSELLWEISQQLSKRLASEVSIVPIYRGYKLASCLDRLTDIGVSETDILRIQLDRRSKAMKILKDHGYFDFVDHLDTKFDVDYSFKTINQLKRDL